MSDLSKSQFFHMAHTETVNISGDELHTAVHINT